VVSGRRASVGVVTLIACLSACVAPTGPAGGAAPSPPVPDQVAAKFGGGDAAPTDDSHSDGGGPITTKADVAGDGASDPADGDLGSADAKADPGAVEVDGGDAKVDAKTDIKADAKPDIGEPVCGDLQCAASESCASCPQDCGPCPAECGNGMCEPGEDCASCSKDCECKATCGDKSCDAGLETCASCPADCGACGPKCGNAACETGENCQTCPADCPCGPKCGDKTCDKATETCQTCPGDCGTCPGECNPITMAGCPSGQQCYPVVIGKPVCAPPGALAVGKPCNALADCALGALCISGVCSAVCDPTGATPNVPCNAPASCGQLSSGSKPLAQTIGVCTGGSTCNLATNAGCSTSLACVSAGLNGTGKACVKPGTGGSNAVCAGSLDCLATHICVNDPFNKKTCVQKCTTLAPVPKCLTGKCEPLSSGTPPKSLPDGLGGCL